MTGSARGLFRATKKRPKKVRVRDLLTGEIIEAEGLPREKDEFYPTKPEPTRAFLFREGPLLRRRHPMIWESAAGDGAMANDLAQGGFQVYRSDLIDRGCGAEIRDYFTYTREDRPSSCMVTNPPFDRVNWRDGRAKWCYHAIETLGMDYMALLLPWSWPGAAGLGKFWDQYPPSRVYLMRWKIDFTNQGAPPSYHAWFIWDRAAPPAGGPLFLTMDKAMDGRQAGLFTE